MKSFYNNLVRKCSNQSGNNARKLADALYKEYVALGANDDNLIGIYTAMQLQSLSTYELEKLTHKKMYRDGRGWYLEKC